MNDTASVTLCFMAAHSQSATDAPVQAEAPAISAASSHAKPPRIRWVGRGRRG